MKLYHLHIRLADGKTKRLTGYAMPHAECCTMKSKFSTSEQARILFVENKPTSCRDCAHGIETYTEVTCTHWQHPGRTMARDLRFEKPPMGFVTGCESLKHCVHFSPNP